MRTLPTPPERHRKRRILVAATAVAAIAATLLAVYVHGKLRAPSEFHPGVTFVATAAPKNIPGSNWPLYGYGPDHTRDFAAPPTLTAPFRTLWTLGGSALLEFPPVLYNGRLFQLNDAGYLHAVNPATGRMIWQVRLGTLAASAPAAAGQSLFVTLLHDNAGGGGVVAVSQVNGRPRWARKLSSASESSPLLDGNRIYIGSQNGTVYAPNTSDGAVQWTYKAASSVKASPSLSNGKLYFGDYSGRMQALQENSGRRVWVSGEKGLLGGGNFYSTAAIAFGRVFAGNTDGRVYAFASSNGRLAWAHQTGAYVYSSPAVADVPGAGPTVYIGSYSGRFYALSAYNGAVRWSFDAHGRISGSPTIIGRIVYFSDLGTHTTWGLNAATGRVDYVRGTGTFDPVISDGTRVYLSGDTGLFALVPYRSPPHPPAKISLCPQLALTVCP